MNWSVLHGSIGILLAGVVIWLGIKTASSHPAPVLVALFGIAAALLGPTSITFMTDAFSSRRNKALEQLAKAGEVEQRVARATTIEQKVRTLEEEQNRLATVIRFEARRLLLEARHEMLKAELGQVAQRIDQIVNEMDEVSHEQEMLGEQSKASSFEKDVFEVRERLKRYGYSSSRESTRWLPDVIRSPMMPISVPIRGPIDKALDTFDDVKTKRLAKKAQAMKVEDGEDEKTADNESEQRP